VTLLTSLGTSLVCEDYNNYCYIINKYLFNFLLYLLP
jgi:hypothetical protein